MKTIIKYIILAIVAVIIGFFIYNKVFVPKHSFSLYKPQKGQLSTSCFGIGEVGAKDIYDIGSPTGGKLLEVYHKQGDKVKKGELLAVVDPVDLPQKLEEAKSLLEHTKLDKKSLIDDEKGVLAKYNLSLKTFNRYKKLYKEGFVSQAEFDKANSDYLDAKSKLNSIKSKIVSFDSLLKQQSESIKGIKERLALLKIYSPVDGQITWKEAEKGESVPPSKTLYKIVDPKTLWVKTYIDERLSGNIKTGLKASIVLRSHSHQIFKGKVVLIEPMSDPITQEREVDVGFVKIPEPFYMLEQAEVTIFTGDLKDIWLIPVKYLATYKQQQGFWIKKGSKAHFITPKIVAEDRGNVGVKDGIEASMEFILPDKTKKSLTEGMKIY